MKWAKTTSGGEQQGGSTPHGNTHAVERQKRAYKKKSVESTNREGGPNKEHVKMVASNLKS